MLPNEILHTANVVPCQGDGFLGGKPLLVGEVGILLVGFKRFDTLWSSAIQAVKKRLRILLAEVNLQIVLRIHLVREMVYAIQCNTIQ